MNRILTYLLLGLVLSACAAPVPTARPLPAPTQALPPALTPTARPSPAMTQTLSPSLTPTARPALRALAERRGLWIGAAVDVSPLANDPQYAGLLAHEFNAVTPENVMKFGPIHPERGRYNFTAGDALVKFAAANGMRVRGHTLVWHNQLPAWVANGQFSRDEWIAILKEHITTVVGHYRGQIAAWDVVNEALSDDGSLRETVWLKNIGPEYLGLAFQWAHEADPAALLFYNDYNTEFLNRKSDRVFALAQDLLKRGIPLNGVGLQMHVTLSPRGAVSPDLQANLQRLGDLGLKVHITELDVRIPQPSSASDLADQAVQYAGVLSACLKVSACQALVMWGFSDRYSWVPSFFKTYDQALIFDRDYRPKPAYQALFETLAAGLP